MKLPQGITRASLPMIIVALLFGAPVPLHAAPAWQIKVEKKSRLAKRMGKYRHIKFNHLIYGFEAHCVVLYPKHRYRARVVDVPKTGLTHPDVKDVAEKHRAVVAFNGGYFLPNFSPAGLFIFRGKKTTALSRQASLSGVFSIDRSGRIHILKRNDPLHQSYYAIQAGPYLIDPGGNMGIKSPGKHRRRTVVGLTTNDNVFIIHTTPVSLYHLAQLLHASPRIFGIVAADRALNLDGGPSSALYAKLRADKLTIKERLAVRNFIVINSRK